jgi:ABC-type multidrug transport system fused ATPase/permease subunit
MRHRPGRVSGSRKVAAKRGVPDLDDHEGQSLPAELLWVWRNILPPKRRAQGLLVLGLMLVGGIAELATIGAVVPLLAIFASSGAPQSGSRVGELMSSLGLDLSAISLTTVAIFFCGVAVATAIVRILLSWVTQRYVFGIRYDVGVALYDRMLHQPYAFHVGVNSSRIISSLERIPTLAAGMLMPLFQACIALIIGTFVVAGLVMLSPFASIVALSGFGLIYGSLAVTAARRLRKNAKVIAKMSRLRLQTVQEGLGGIGDVLLDNAQPVYVRNFTKIDEKMRKAEGANALIASTPRFVAEAAGIILMAVLAVILHRQQGGAAASLPVLGALALGAQRLLPLMQQTYFGWASILSNRSLFLNTVTLLRQPMPVRNSAERISPFHSAIELRAIDFAYASDQPSTLRDINLQIPKGSRVGFVGKSGSGKTTLLNLVMGLLDPTSGEIRVDGHRLSESNKQSWQKQVARVPQSIFLTDGSIAENIAMGTSADGIDQDKLRHVCRLADIAEFIENLPQGYLTPVGERGVRLSGGQIQRIGLARALYKDATVLVLDEATSALDDTTEANIIESVRRLGRQFTVLMIAHRTTTLRECDIIFRLDSGKLVESGSPEEVLGSAVRVIKPKSPASEPRAMRRSAGLEQ